MPAEPREWAAPLPFLRGDRWRAVLPAVVLAGVALVGVRNHIDHGQSSWEGASFGMFSTYDNDQSRLVVVTVTGADGPYRADLPADLRDDARRLAVAPSQGAIDRLARNAAERVRADTTVVTVELWHLVVDHGGQRLRYERSLVGTATP